MKTNIITLLFVICSFNLNAQYKSVFGSNTTRWNIFRQVIDASWTEAYFCFSDTLIDQKTYKVLYNKILYTPDEELNTDSKIITGVLFEDTTIGKLWIRYNDNEKLSKEYLLMDLSLKKGDTADVFLNWRGAEYERIEVNSVYYKNNLKTISLKNGLLFIESVGPTCGFEGSFINGYNLLCKYNNNTLVFSNGLCFFSFEVGVENVKSEQFKIQKKSDCLEILFESDARRILKIYDLVGVNMQTIQFSGSAISIPLPEGMKGIYILKIETNNEKQSLKLIL